MILQHEKAMESLNNQIESTKEQIQHDKNREITYPKRQKKDGVTTKKQYDKQSERYEP